MWGRRSSPKPPPPGRGEEEEEERRGRTPRGRGGRLRRGPRPAAAQAGDRTEEVSSQKTPQRGSHYRHDSPCNDSQQQQEIYWDQHSPTVFKIGHGKKASAASQHDVKISDVVKRIAPQQSNSTVPMNIWLGEDAMQYSPSGPFRSRLKINHSRCKRSTEEELMKLAKEFDRNLVEQEVGHEGDPIETKQRSVCIELEQIARPQNCVILLSSKPVTGPNTGNAAPSAELHRQQTSQPPLNEAAEAAVNALFDGPTQHISGTLSQNCSGDEISQRVGEGSHPTKAVTTSMLGNRDIPSQVNRCSKSTGVKEPLLQCLSLKSAGLLSEQNSNTQGVASLAFDRGKCPLSGKLTVSEKGQGATCTTGSESCRDIRAEPQTAAGVVSYQTEAASTTDKGLDDWDSDDWMDDDSFNMEIIQNPELIATPKDIPKQPDRSTDTAKQSVAREAVGMSKPGVPSRSVALPSHFQSPTGKLKDTKRVAKILQYERGSERPKARATFMLQSRSSNNVIPKGSGEESKVPVKGKEQQLQEIPKPYCVTHSLHASQTLPCTKPRLVDGGQQGGGETLSQCPKPALAPGLKPRQEEATAQRTLVTQRRIDPPKQSPAAATTMTTPLAVDDWNDSEFSDEVLDMLSQSDRLCELEEEEDDDDLYRVCDDVERLMECESAGLATAEEKSGPKVTAPCPLPTGRQRSPLSKRVDSSLKPLNRNRISSEPGTQGWSREPVAGARHMASTSPPRNAALALPLATIFPTAAHNSRTSRDLQSKASGNATNWSRSLSMSALKSNPGNHPEWIPAPHTACGQGVFKSVVAVNHLATSCQAASATNGKPSSSKFSFTRTMSSSGSGAQGNHVSSSAETFGNASHFSLQANMPNAAVQGHRGLPLKRLHSDSALQIKVLKTPSKPVTKCSQAKIEQKKLEALARRRLKLQAISPNM